MGNDAKRGLLCPEGPGQAEGESSVSTGDPCSQQHRVHETRHTGTPATDHRTPQGKVPAQGGLGHPFAFQAQNQHPGLKQDAAASAPERGHTQESEPSKDVQTSPREAAPSLGSAMEPHSPGLPHTSTSGAPHQGW